MVDLVLKVYGDNCGGDIFVCVKFVLETFVVMVPFFEIPTIKWPKYY